MKPTRRAPEVTQAPGRAPEHKSRSARRDRVIFFGPLVVTMATLLAFPLVFAIYASFADIDNLFSLEFAGLANYQSLFERTDNLGRPFFNTLRYTLGVVVLQMAIGFAAALLLNSQLRGRRWFRTALMMPWVIPSVIAALTWRWMFDAQSGLVNGLLVQVGILDGPRSWLGDPSIAPWAVIAVSVWRGFPFVTVMLLAALQTIPKELYEAAELDGAGPVRRMRHITIPGIRAIAALVALMEGLWAFREFALIQVLTAGGPAGSTEVLATLVYRLFFEFQEFGAAAALAVLMFTFVLIASVFLIRYTREEDES